MYRWLPLICLLLSAACSTVPSSTPSASEQNSTLRDAPVSISGRSVFDSDGSLRFGYPGVSVSLAISGGSLSMEASSTGGQNHLLVEVEGAEPVILTPTTEPTQLPIAHASGPTQVRLTHLSETWHGLMHLHRLTLTGGEFLPAPQPPARKMLVIGDSVTCGEAVHRTADCRKNSRWWRPDQSWGMLLARNLDAEVHLVCYGGRGLTRSWNGNTDELQAPAFVDLAIAVEEGPRWPHASYQPELILISLGTNDFSLGIGPLPAREHFVRVYTEFVKGLQKRYPGAHIVLTEGAIVNDVSDPARPQKTRLREYIAATVEATDNGRVHQLPSRHYPGDACDAHPTGDQHQRMAEDFTEPLKKILWP